LLLLLLLKSLLLWKLWLWRQTAGNGGESFPCIRRPAAHSSAAAVLAFSNQLKDVKQQHQ
jgi:hypothetical protein